MKIICLRCKRERDLGAKGFCESCYSGIIQHIAIVEGRVSEEKREKARIRTRIWYNKNKERQKATVKQYYHSIKQKHNLRTHTNFYRKLILDYFENKCIQCNSSYNLEIDHLNYDGVNLLNLKDFVRVLCRPCHRKSHRLSEKNTNIDTIRSYHKVTL